MSSANCEIFILRVCSSIFIWKPLISLLFHIRRGMISTDKTNSKADKAQPWHILHKFLKISDIQPLFITQVWILLYKVLTQIINDSLNLKCFKVVNFNFLTNPYSYYVTIWSGCYFHWMTTQNRWPHSRSSSCILVTSCILQLTANAWQTILISHQYHKIHFF